MSCVLDEDIDGGDLFDLTEHMVEVIFKSMKSQVRFLRLIKELRAPGASQILGPINDTASNPIMATSAEAATSVSREDL